MTGILIWLWECENHWKVQSWCDVHLVSPCIYVLSPWPHTQSCVDAVGTFLPFLLLLSCSPWIRGELPILYTVLWSLYCTVSCFSWTEAARAHVKIIDGHSTGDMHCPSQVILESRSRHAHWHKSYHVCSLSVVGFGWQNICPRVAPVVALHVQHAELFCLDPKPFGAIVVFSVIAVFWPSPALQQGWVTHTCIRVKLFILRSCKYPGSPLSLSVRHRFTVSDLCLIKVLFSLAILGMYSP